MEKRLSDKFPVHLVADFIALDMLHELLYQRKLNENLLLFDKQKCKSMNKNLREMQLKLLRLKWLRYKMHLLAHSYEHLKTSYQNADRRWLRWNSLEHFVREYAEYCIKNAKIDITTVST